MTVVFLSAPGQRAAVFSDSMSRWRVIDPVMAVIPSVLIRWDCDPLRGRASRGFAGADEVGEVPADYRAAGAGRAWGPVSFSPPGVSASPAAGLAGGAIWIGWAGWAGRNKTARRAPAAATPAATRQLMVRPRRNALAAACCSACPRPGWPRAAILPAATYAAPTDWCAIAATRPGTLAGREAVSRDPYTDA